MATITDDDDPPTIDVQDVAVVEGNAGQVDCVVTVLLNRTSSSNIMVNFETVDDEERDIFLSFPERGKVYGHDAQAVIEILPEVSLSDRF